MSCQKCILFSQKMVDKWFSCHMPGEDDFCELWQGHVAHTRPMRYYGVLPRRAVMLLVARPIWVQAYGCSESSRVLAIVRWASFHWRSLNFLWINKKTKGSGLSSIQELKWQVQSKAEWRTECKNYSILLIISLICLFQFWTSKAVYFFLCVLYTPLPFLVAVWKSEMVTGRLQTHHKFLLTTRNWVLITLF